MERVLAEELEVAQFRATLQSLVREVGSFRKEAARTHESRQVPSPPTLLSFSPSPDDQATLAAHLDRAREQEHKAVLMKRAESLRQDAESKSEECKKLRKENEAQRRQLLEALDECAKEKTKRAVMSSLIDTLRANQDELGAQIKAMFEEKTDLEASVKLAEESTRTSVRALQSMSDETAQLRASVGRGDAQYRKMSAARDALERDLAVTKTEAAKQAHALETAESEKEASQEQAAARSKDARQAELLAEMARSEAASADERCSATTTALNTLSTELETLRTSFDVERNANCEATARLLSSEAEGQGGAHAAAITGRRDHLAQGGRVRT
jgi:DNA repair exonuclease SbcCD ATPase subunit